MRPYSLLGVAIVAPALLLAGCGMHALRSPGLDATAPKSFTGQENSAVAEAGRWWEKFGDKRLDALMEEAFSGNLDIAAAGERLAQAEALAKEAGAARFPAVNAGAQAGRARSVIATTRLTSDTYRLSASASYEIDLWKKVASGAAAARLEADASKEDMLSMYISVSARLADLYYLAVEQKTQLELTDSTIETFKDTLERVERRYRQGLVPALDVYQSRQNLAIAQSSRPVYEANLEKTRHAISVILGRFPEEALFEQGSTPLPEPPEFNAGLPSLLLKRRPDIEAALLRVKASDYKVGAAVADRFPSFNLVGEYGGSSTRLASVLDSPNIFWNLFIQAALPVIDGGRRKAEVERTDAAFRESLSRYRQTVLTSFREVEDALSSARASKERIGTLKERVDASRAGLRLSLDRYLAGLSDYLPVLTEQQRLFEAESALIAARRQFISDRIELVRALGGGWANGVAEKRMSALDGRKEDGR